MSVTLGRSAFVVAPIGIGTYLFNGSADVLRATVGDVPVLVDTSSLYGTEEVVGRAARAGRDDLFVATKVFPDCYSADALKGSVLASLGRMGLEHIDLLQLHWPNHSVPMAETIGAMEDLIDEGVIRSMGVCNHPVEALRAAMAAAKRHPVVSNQISYSLYDRRFEDELIPFCEANGVTVISYSPLGGRLSALLERDSNGALERIAKRHAVGPAEIAIAWVMRRDGIVSISKSDSAERLRANAAAAGMKLSDDEYRELASSVRPRRIRGQLEERARGAVRALMYHPSGQRTLLGRAAHNARDLLVAVKTRIR